MLNKNVKICDISSIAVNDGKSLFPGYIEINKDGVFQFYSDDPINSSKEEGILKNRVEYLRKEKLTEYDPTMFITGEEELYLKDIPAIEEWIERCTF